ncbi:unnamed protein product [Blepharisma stoltei]|uniref:Uncharacterized protein n=1 Tax=Blepharisma stoltei TaxID=1481888 RepID=A0AAU9JY28_9CILI|nr:unnamed protein product [Blepharisma stoltei]
MFSSIAFYILLALFALYFTWKNQIKAKSQAITVLQQPQTIPISSQPIETPAPSQNVENEIPRPSQEAKEEPKTVEQPATQMYTVKTHTPKSINQSENKENVSSASVQNNDTKYNIVLKSKPASKPEEKRKNLELTSFILKETEKSIQELISKPRSPLESINPTTMRSQFYDPNVPEFQPKLRLNPNAQDFCPIK